MPSFTGRRRAAASAVVAPTGVRESYRGGTALAADGTLLVYDHVEALM